MSIVNFFKWIKIEKNHLMPKVGDMCNIAYQVKTDDVWSATVTFGILIDEKKKCLANIGRRFVKWNS